MLAGCSSGGSSPGPLSPKVACADLGKLQFEGNTTVTSATAVTEGTLVTPANQTIGNLPSFCRVQGVSKPTADSNIGFEVWLPADTWNGRFMSSGEGGYVGALNYTRNGLDGGLDEILRRGYATASTDTGHLASDANWAIGHPEKVVDYAYRAKHLVTVAAKGLIAAYYGQPATRSYLNSCSNGGRQALMEVQRYPEDYDGVVAGAPWNFQSHSAAGMIWTAQALDAPGAAIPAAKLQLIQDAVVSSCDIKDGLADGLIEDPRNCNFEPSTLLCQGAESDACLTAPQVAALAKLYQGPRNPRTGEQIYAGWAPGSEASWTGIVANSPTSSPFSLGRTYFADLVYGDTAWDYRSFNFDSDMAFADAKIGSIANAMATDMTAAKNRGVKIIMYQGWNDQVLQPGHTPNYYEQVAQAMGGLVATQEFSRLFMVPGMTHCYFGPGATSFGGVGQQIPPERDPLHDLQKALENWVENGVAPEAMIATKYADDKASTRTVKMTRLLCSYPEVARYKAGNPDDANNFECVSP
jgi:feruloyl esterase